jgi:hypothetical protein
MSIIQSGWLTIGRWWGWFALRLLVFVSFLWVLASIIIGISALFGGEFVAEVPHAIAFAFVCACYIAVILWVLFITFLLWLGLLFDSLINWVTNLFKKGVSAGSAFIQDMKKGASRLVDGLKEGAKKAAHEVRDGWQKLYRFGRWLKRKVMREEEP